MKQSMLIPLGNLVLLHTLNSMDTERAFFAASVLNEAARLIKDKLQSWLTRKSEENPSPYIMSIAPQVSLVIAMR